MLRLNMFQKQSRQFHQIVKCYSSPTYTILAECEFCDICSKLQRFEVLMKHFEAASVNAALER